jgi:hypothetical protein
VPAPAEPAARMQLIDRVTQHSDTILTNPLSELFGVPVTVGEARLLEEGTAQQQQQQQQQPGQTREVPAAAAAAAGTLPAVEAAVNPRGQNSSSSGGSPAPVEVPADVQTLPGTAYQSAPAPVVQTTTTVGPAAAAANTASPSPEATTAPPPAPAPAATQPAQPRRTKQEKTIGPPLPPSGMLMPKPKSRSNAKPLPLNVQTLVPPASLSSTWAPALPPAMQPSPSPAVTYNVTNNVSNKTAVTWSGAPTCESSVDAFNSEPDTEGRLWGWESEASCAFRQPGRAADDMEPVIQTWQTARPCIGLGTEANSVADLQGQLWGWQNGRSCAFRAPQPSEVAAAQAATWQQQQRQMDWEGAPDCKQGPTVFTSVSDSVGRLWGWEDDRSCRFVRNS